MEQGADALVGEDLDQDRVSNASVDDAGLGNAYQNAKVEIDVRAQAVQCANNGSDPLSATGWE